MFQWTDFEAVIPAVMSIPERAASVNNLLCDLAKQCKGIVARVAPQWEPQRASPDVYHAISAALAGVRKPWVLYFEDDVVLSSRFGVEALKVLDKIDGNVGSVALYSPRADDVLRLQRGESLYNPGGPFLYIQCNIIRQDVAFKMADELIRQLECGKSIMTPDIVLGDVCQQMRQKILVSLPSLVQHRRGPSVFGSPKWQESPTFVP
jgi:hypothetical protein